MDQQAVVGPRYRAVCEVLGGSPISEAVRPALSECGCGGCTKPTTGPGDQDDLVGERIARHVRDRACVRPKRCRCGGASRAWWRCDRD